MWHASESLRAACGGCRRIRIAIHSGAPRTDHLAGLSPDGSRIAYVFRARKSMVFLHENERPSGASWLTSRVATATGWALRWRAAGSGAVQRRGGADLFACRRPARAKRLTVSDAIDTERDFSPGADARCCLHLNRSVAARDLRMAAAGGNAERHHLRRHLQRHTAIQPGRQVFRVISAARAATAGDHGSRCAPGAGLDRRAARRFADLRAATGRLVMYASILRGVVILAPSRATAGSSRRSPRRQDVASPAWGAVGIASEHTVPPGGRHIPT